MISVRTLAAMTFALTAFAPAQAASPCKPDEIGIIACPHSKSELRVIRGTLSPGKHYAIAWATEDGSTGSDYELIKHDEYSARFADASGRPSWCGSPTARR